MLMPSRVKYRKMHRGSRSGLAGAANTVAFGEYGLQCLERCWMDTKQIEAARGAINRNMKRRGKVWIRIFPDKAITKRPADTRMGSGKGDPDYWVAVIKPGKILYEMKGVSEPVARAAMRIASYKMPVKTQFLVRPAAQPAK